jgi:hypothetical protein
VNITKTVKFQLEMSYDEADKLSTALGRVLEYTKHLDRERQDILVNTSTIDRVLALKQLIVLQLEG